MGTAQKHPWLFGKDEVGGSNPPSSSKKSCFLSKTGLFLYFLTNLICGSGCGSTLTHTLTHTRKYAERAKEHRRGSSVSSPVFLCFRRLHHLCHEATHGLGGFVLLLAGGVGVGAECESGIVVARHALFADLSCNEKFLSSKFEPGNFFVESITRALSLPAIVSLPAIDRYGAAGRT